MGLIGSTWMVADARCRGSLTIGFGCLDSWMCKIHWLRAEYFVKHLLGDYRWNVDITPLNNVRPQTR